MKHVESLKRLLAVYRFNPFIQGSARDITTDKELNHGVVERLLASNGRGEKEFQAFMKHRLLSQKTDLFRLIKRQQIETGMKKKKNITKIQLLRRT